MRLIFQARQTKFHSPVTLRNPRKENCLNPITDLMVPKTGSTVCLRRAKAALPLGHGELAQEVFIDAAESVKFQSGWNLRDLFK